jgi:ABC-2 type transport system permease protein
MRKRLSNIFHMGVKELLSLRRDPVLLAMILWAFSLSIYIAATSISHDLHHASIGIVDEDRSTLSRRIAGAFLPPRFQPPHYISFGEIDAGMDMRRFTFTLVIPSGFESDLLRGDHPSLQLNIDATAIMQAGIGAGYINQVITGEVLNFVDTGQQAALPVTLETRFAFNPNLDSAWFTSIMEIINNVTMLTILLTGAALIREREHGTIEHLLVMPLSPFEIVMAKVWASGLVVLTATAFSLWIMVRQVLDVPIHGSVPLFLAGTLLYLFFTSALGVFMGTIARSMPQFGLLFILIILPMNLLSGGQTPAESQPELLRAAMQLVPSTHFVDFAQAILYRGAGIAIVWPHFLAVAVMGAVFFSVSVLRFRRSIAQAGK